MFCTTDYVSHHVLDYMCITMFWTICVLPCFGLYVYYHVLDYILCVPPCFGLYAMYLTMFWTVGYESHHVLDCGLGMGHQSSRRDSRKHTKLQSSTSIECDSSAGLAK